MREMKDSGIEWIGEIPKDWEIIKTKYVADISIGLVTTMTANYVDNLDDGVYLIRNGDIRLNKISKDGWCGWWPDEQLYECEKEKILNQIDSLEVDFVFTHTCPLEFQPTDLFLSCVDQSIVYLFI